MFYLYFTFVFVEVLSSSFLIKNKIRRLWGHVYTRQFISEIKILRLLADLRYIRVSPS